MKPTITLHWDRYRNKAVHVVGIGWCWRTWQGEREFQVMFGVGIGTLRIFTLWP